MPKTEIGKKIAKVVDTGERVVEAAKNLKKACEDLIPKGPDSPAQT